MTTTQWALNTLNTSDAAFRAWGQGISTALAAIGMVKTSDTGQIDWATVTLPGTGVYGGYEVWRFNDALQATAPLFLKVEYGTGTTSTRTKVQLTLGKGSNGSGTLTGQFTGSPLTCQAGVNGTTTVRNWYASSADGSTFVIVGAPEFSGFNFAFGVERSRAANGAALGTAFVVLFGQTTSMGASTYNYASGSTMSTGWPLALLGTVGLAAGGVAPVFPVVLTDGLGMYWQPRSFLNAMAPDVPAQSPITIPGFGVYLPLGSTFKWDPNIYSSGLMVWS